MSLLLNTSVPKGVHLSPDNMNPTPDSLAALNRERVHITAAAERHPVVIGPQGVVFYDPEEYGLPGDPMSFGGE